MNKFRLIMLDLFFVISSIIGVGFATGKEIAHYFTSGKNIFIAVAVFAIVFISLSLYLLYIKNKYNVNNLMELNKLAFGRYYEICNIMLVIFLIVTNSAMLAGCDNIVRTYLGFNIPVGSLFLSCITFFVVLGGIGRIKNISKVVAPIIIILILFIACTNFKISSCDGNYIFDIAYPIIFCAHNFILLITVILNTKSNPKLVSCLSGILISCVILISAFAINGVSADMPMLVLGKNLGKVWFFIFLIGVIFALFTTLQIGTFQCLQIVNKNKKQKMFVLAIILLTCQIIAYLGFSFIIQYLYALMGILGVIYLIVLITSLIIKNKINKNQQNK